MDRNTLISIFFSVSSALSSGSILAQINDNGVSMPLRDRINLNNTDTLAGVITDVESDAGCPFAIIRVAHKRIASMTDENGHFTLLLPYNTQNDTLLITAHGFEEKKIALSTLTDNERAVIKLTPVPFALPEYKVRAGKVKSVKVGKKHSSGLLSSYIGDQDKGECYGLELHSSKNKELWLDRVGFYIQQTEDMMKKMKFRINIYDISGVKKLPADQLKSYGIPPIYFDYDYAKVIDGKYTFVLPDYIKLPKDAMVEIEFLEPLTDEKIWFKSNLIGKKSWMRMLKDGYWDRLSLSVPFFVECIETYE